LDPETLLEIREIILGEPTVAELNWVTGRNAGRFRFVEAQLTLRLQDLERAEVVTRRIEERIDEAVPYVERVLIHAEPMERNHLRYAAPLEAADGALSKHFGEAPTFALIRVRLEDGLVTERRLLPNPYLEEDRAKGIRVAEWLVEQKVDVVFLKESLRGKGPVYVFGDAGVELRETEAGTLEEALEEARKEDAR
jgi:predicted Fe-Mo cluster-binding NifX family protein